MAFLNFISARWCRHWCAECRSVAMLMVVALVALVALVGMVGSNNALAQSPESPESSSSPDSLVPGWVSEGSFDDGGDQIELLKTEDVFLRSEASMILADLVRSAVCDRIDQVVENKGAYRYVPVSDQYIQRHLIEQEMVIEKRTVDLETNKEIRRHQGFARLRWGSTFDDYVRDRHHVNFQTQRLQWAGLATILGITWLAAVYGYLRLDTATRHFYSRRLQTLAIVSCLIPLVVAVWLAVVWGLF